MKIFFSSKIELANSLVNNRESIKYAGAEPTLIRVNKLSFLLKNATNQQLCHSILYGPRTYNPEVVSSSPVQFVFFTLNDFLFHQCPHDHFLMFPSLGSNPSGC